MHEFKYQVSYYYIMSIKEIFNLEDVKSLLDIIVESKSNIGLVKELMFVLNEMIMYHMKN